MEMILILGRQIITVTYEGEVADVEVCSVQQRGGHGTVGCPSYPVLSGEALLDNEIQNFAP